MSIGSMTIASLKPSCIINFHTNYSLIISLTNPISPSHLQQSPYGFQHLLNSRTLNLRKRVILVNGGIDSIPPSPSSTPPLTPGVPGKGWIAGSVISLLLPFLRNKWGPLFTFKQEVDKDMEVIEHVVEALEEVAERVDKAAEEFSEHLPEGRLKSMANEIEQVAELVAETAHLTDTAIDKVQQLEDEAVSYITKKQNQKDA